MHPNFPGQFRHLAPALREHGADVRALTLSEIPANTSVPTSAPTSVPTSVPTTRAPLVRGHSPELDPLLQPLDSKLIRGRSAMQQLRQWRDEGWVPELIIGHTGWGDMLGLKEMFPQAKVLGWFEFYYHSTGLDLDFDPEFPPSEEARLKARLKNMWPLWMLEQVDQGVCPTRFQRDVHPSPYHSRLNVVHEGIDTQRFVPKDSIQVTLGAGLTLTREDEVITFVNRDLEPYRGYHVFMRALPALLARHPSAHVLIVGGDKVSYGAAAPEGTSWKQIFLDEVRHQLDPRRVHFLGKVPHNTLIGLMQLSRAHVYLTYPFVLSWSLLEAMSCAAPVIGSDTAPVREVITHGENGLLVDFFDTQALVEQISYALSHPDAMQPLRDKARASVIEHYDLNSYCLPQQLALVSSLLG
ncbi:MAG TPA: glycosyl transferase [Halomonas sp.]|nr:MULTISPECIES: glycosyltransferase [unclassified Halomonas]HAA45290.1 glycosyl transferase [Halomonas sp.]